MFLSKVLSINDTIINGTAKPAEYIKSSNTPYPKVACPAAKNNIEPNTAPIQGVQPMDKAIPIKTEPKKPFVLGVFTLDAKLKIPKFITPSILSPKSIITAPLIILKTFMFFAMNAPNAEAAMPKSINIIVNPIINPAVLVKIKNLPFFELSSIDTPAIYAIYAGIKGNMQGEKNEVTPAIKATESVTSFIFMYMPPLHKEP